MNITIISHNYTPESSGIGYYSTEMAEFLAKENEVTVITAFPYYPQWSIYPEYREKPTYLTEFINGVRVKRFKMFTPQKPTFISRIQQMISFYRGSINNLKEIEKSDVVVVVVPFTLSILLGSFLKKRLGAKLWIHVQDFEFDAAVETGVLSSIPLLPKVLSKVEKVMMRKTDRCSSISFAMLDKLQTKTQAPTVYFPNWINEKSIDPSKAKKHPFFKEGKINVLYSGNIGAKQDWDSFIEVVNLFQKNENVHFILVGDGAQKEEVVQKIENFTNIDYHPPVELSDLNNLLCGADIHILLQKPEVVDTVMPSKLLGMMASEKPSLVTGNEKSEVKLHMEKAQAGVYISSNNATVIAAHLSEMIDQISMFQGNIPRNYVIEHFSHNKVLGKFQQQLENLK